MIDPKNPVFYRNGDKTWKWFHNGFHYDSDTKDVTKAIQLAYQKSPKGDDGSLKSNRP